MKSNDLPVSSSDLDALDPYEGGGELFEDTMGVDIEQSCELIDDVCDGSDPYWDNY